MQPYCSGPQFRGVLSARSEPEAEEPFWVWLCDVRFGIPVEQHLDQLIRHFANPIAALKGLSGQERQQSIRDIHQSRSVKWIKFLAHCSSLEDMRIIASLEKVYWEQKE